MTKRQKLQHAIDILMHEEYHETDYDRPDVIMRPYEEKKYNISTTRRPLQIITQLPSEVLREILTRVPYTRKNLLAILQTCRQFHTIVTEDDGSFKKAVIDLQCPIVYRTMAAVRDLDIPKTEGYVPTTEDLLTSKNMSDTYAIAAKMILASHNIKPHDEGYSRKSSLLFAGLLMIDTMRFAGAQAPHKSDLRRMLAVLCLTGEAQALLRHTTLLLWKLVARKTISGSTLRRLYPRTLAISPGQRYNTSADLSIGGYLAREDRLLLVLCLEEFMWTSGALGILNLLGASSVDSLVTREQQFTNFDALLLMFRSRGIPRRPQFYRRRRAESILGRTGYHFGDWSAAILNTDLLAVSTSMDAPDPPDYVVSNRFRPSVSDDAYMRRERLLVDQMHDQLRATDKSSSALPQLKTSQDIIDFVNCAASRLQYALAIPEGGLRARLETFCEPQFERHEVECDYCIRRMRG